MALQFGRKFKRNKYGLWEGDENLPKTTDYMAPQHQQSQSAILESVRRQSGVTPVQFEGAPENDKKDLNDMLEEIRRRRMQQYA